LVNFPGKAGLMMAWSVDGEPFTLRQEPLFGHGTAMHLLPVRKGIRLNHRTRWAPAMLQAGEMLVSRNRSGWGLFSLRAIARIPSNMVSSAGSVFELLQTNSRLTDRSAQAPAEKGQRLYCYERGRAEQRLRPLFRAEGPLLPRGREG